MNPSPRSRFFWLSLILVAGAFFSYIPALSGLPIWDDNYLVGGNPLFRSPIFVLEVFRNWLLPDSLIVYYRPVQNLSYMVDYLVWCGNPIGYHLTNILVHGAAAVFIFLLMDRLLPKLLERSGDGKVSVTTRWMAFGIAGIWVVHPIHNAAVAYISGRADSLVALFAASGWLLFLLGTESKAPQPARRIACFLGAGVLALLALCSKEIAIAWIAVFAIVHLFLIRSSVNKGRIVAALLFLLGSYYLLRHLPESRIAEAKMEPAPFGTRVVLMVRALGDYTRLILWPDKLYMCRSVAPDLLYKPMPAFPKVEFGSLSLLAAVTAAAFALGMRRRGRGWPLRRLGAIWFLVGFLPVSNLIPLNAQVAEHWIYMPSLGFLLFLAGCWLETPAAWHRAGAAILCVAAVALGTRTYFRSEEWTTPERFFSSTLRDGGHDPRVFVQLAQLYLAHGQPVKAEKILRPLLAEYPDSSLVKIGLAFVLTHEGGRDEEVESLLRAVGPRYYSDFSVAKLNLARMELKKGHPDAALAIIDAALAQEVPPIGLIPFKVQLLQHSGRTTEAIALGNAYIEERWWDLPAKLTLATLYSKTGDPQAALNLLESAAWLDIWDSKALAMAAEIELSRNRPSAAIEFAERGLHRKPTVGECQRFAAIFHKLDRPGDAEAALRLAKELNPTTKIDRVDLTQSAVRE